MLVKQKGVRKKYLLIFSLVLFSIFVLSSVNATITIHSPANFTNHTTSIAFIVNYTNSTANSITDAVNATLYYNSTSTGAWTYLGVLTSKTANGTAGNHSLISFTGTITISSITDGIYNISAILASANGSTSRRIWGEGIRFDDTAPKVTNYYIKLTNGTILTNSGRGYITGIPSVFNVTVNDTGVRTINSVSFNISYSNGTQIFYNVTTGVANNYTVTLNLSNLDTNAIYHITAYANDSLNNLNKTEIFKITFDNTAPTATFTCSPTPVTSSGTVNCVCTPLDNIEINTALTVYTSKPSVSTTGTHTLTCTFSDSSGNAASKTTTYTVNSADSGSATTTGSVQTATTTPEKINTWTTVTAETPVVMQDFASASSIKQIEIEVSSKANNVQLTVNEYSSKPSGVSVSQADSYKYFKIDTLNLVDKLSKATIQIKVEKSWVSQKGIDKTNVALFKFDETAKRWNELTTTFKSEDTTYYYYDVELTSFSYFVIAPTAVVSGEESQVTGGEETQTTPSNSWVWIIVTLVILALITVVFVVFGKKKRK